MRHQKKRKKVSILHSSSLDTFFSHVYDHQCFVCEYARFYTCVLMYSSVLILLKLIFTGNALHAMDCTDIVIGAARGSQSRILDYYTRDRATPRLDEFYGGQQSLTAAVGMEVGNVTIIKFRKRLATSECTFDLLHPHDAVIFGTYEF